MKFCEICKSIIIDDICSNKKCNSNSNRIFTEEYKQCNSCKESFPKNEDYFKFKKDSKSGKYYAYYICIICGKLEQSAYRKNIFINRRQRNG